jgi:tight adherence protein B
LAERVDASDVEVVLAIDTSGSMTGAPIAAAREAAARFVASLPEGTRVAITGFSATPTVVTPMTADRGAALSGIAGLGSRGETALHDALVTGAGLYSPADAVRSLVVLSDGRDTVSQAAEADAVARVRDARANLTVVDLASRDRDPEALGRIAAGSGGRVVAASDPAALDGVYADAARLISSQHRLRYRSEHPGATHLRVVADGGPAAELDVTFPATLAAPPSGDGESMPVARSRVGEVQVVAWYAGDLGMRLGAAAVAIGLAMLLIVLINRNDGSNEPWKKVALPSGGTVHRAGISEVVGGATALAGRFLDRRGGRGWLNRALERAGLPLRAEEFLVLVTATLVIVMGLTSMLTNTFILTVMAGGFVLVGAKLLLSQLASRRQKRFDDQLSDTLQLLAGSLRTGYGLLQAIDGVAREAEAPTSDEFRRVTTEIRLGRDVPDALASMAERVGGSDLAWVVQAVEIHREVGGNLAEVLDNVAATIRERHRVKRQVLALSAEGRLSAYVLLGLPFGLGFLMSLFNPTYLGELTGSGTGVMLLGVAAVLMSVGALWLRKIINPET